MKFTKKGLLALASFVLLVLQAFGVKVDVPVVNEIIASLASLLVVLGIITDSTKKTPPTDGESGDGEQPPTDPPVEDGEEATDESDASDGESSDESPEEQTPEDGE